MSGRRVVVTGLGLVTALGAGTAKNWRRLVGGECGIRGTEELGPAFTSLASRVAAWVDPAELEPFLATSRDARALPRYIQFALVAAEEAMRDAGHHDAAGTERGGVCIGCGMAPLDLVGEAHQTLQTKGARRVSPHLIPRILPNMGAGHVSIRFGLRGPLLTPSSACATGAHSIGDAFRLIRHGYADLMVAGGTEAAVNPLSIAGFAQARALCTSFNDDPRTSSRPFDKQRDGFVIGEGAGVVVLEEREAAIKRGARIHGEILGYGSSADAFHITASHPDGRGAEDAMRAALHEAGVDARKVVHVNAHATSTPIGDLAEARAINRLFAEHQPMVTANKGAMGHLLGAAGAVESVITILSLREGMIPPTLNYGGADAEDIARLRIASQCQSTDARIALCNSFGFGGTNASLCFASHTRD